MFIYNHKASQASLTQNDNQPNLGEEDVYNHRCISPNVFTVIWASITLKAAWSIMKRHVLNVASRQSCTRHTIETFLTASEGEGFRQSCGMCFFITGFYSVVFQHHTPLLNLGQCVPPTLAVLSAAGLHIFHSWVGAGKTDSFCLSSWGWGSFGVLFAALFGLYYSKY